MALALALGTVKAITTIVARETSGHPLCSSSNRGGARYLLGFEERGELQLAVAAIAVYILRVPPILLLLDFTDGGCRPDITSYSGTWL